MADVHGTLLCTQARSMAIWLLLHWWVAVRHCQQPAALATAVERHGDGLRPGQQCNHVECILVNTSCCGRIWNLKIWCWRPMRPGFATVHEFIAFGVTKALKAPEHIKLGLCRLARPDRSDRAGRAAATAEQKQSCREMPQQQKHSLLLLLADHCVSAFLRELLGTLFRFPGRQL